MELYLCIHGVDRESFTFYLDFNAVLRILRKRKRERVRVSVCACERAIGVKSIVAKPCVNGHCLKQ